MGKKYDEVMARLDPAVIYDYELLDLNDCDDCYDPENVCMAVFGGLALICLIFHVVFMRGLFFALRLSHDN